MTKTASIVEELLQYKKAYYSGKPLVSDAEFDMLEDKLRKISPNDPYFKVVGTPLQNDKQKYKHTIPMLSCSKTKDIGGVEKWLNKIGQGRQEIIIEEKIDGASIDLHYVDGKLVSAATRGSGSEGQLIFTTIQHISKFPKTITLKGDINIRGEAVIYTDSDIENEGDTNLRNICSGALNRKTIVPEELKEIHFIAYQMYGSDFDKESDKIDWLKKNGFETTDYVVVKSIKEIENYYNEYVAKTRSKIKYSMDGLVLVINDSTLHDKIDSLGSTDHDHLYATALKFPNESAETILEDIEWQVSRQGRLQPVAIFKPVVIDGARITKASLTNYAAVIRMKMEKGDKLEIVKAGSVIPYVESNISKGVSQR